MDMESSDIEVQQGEHTKKCWSIYAANAMFMFNKMYNFMKYFYHLSPDLCGRHRDLYSNWCITNNTDRKQVLSFIPAFDYFASNTDFRLGCSFMIQKYKDMQLIALQNNNMNRLNK